MTGLAGDLLEALAHPAWGELARPNQRPPAGDWRVWLILAGRGWGKTRTGAEWVREQVETGACKHLAFVGATAADVRDVMVEGSSGILAISSPHFRPEYEPSKRRLTWPNGATATTYSADEPERLRGPQHDGAWCDEIAAWRFPGAWDMLLFGLRIGPNPRAVVTTTPRPTRLIRDLLSQSTTAVTRGSTFENLTNLAPAFAEQIISRYEGTRLGRQELNAEILDDLPGALWQRDRIDALRLSAKPKLARVVVAIDPAVTAEEGSDETGIIVAGKGSDGHGYVLADYSGRYSPLGWANRAVEAYQNFRADRIVAEKNQGGDMVASTLRAVDANVPLKLVTASRGKVTRAEPIAALYEQGKAHHVGSFPDLEDQMCLFTPDHRDGPDDRVDALVWAFTELTITGRPHQDPAAIFYLHHCPTCQAMVTAPPWVPEARCQRCGWSGPRSRLRSYESRL